MHVDQRKSTECSEIHPSTREIFIYNLMASQIAEEKVDILLHGVGRTA